MKAVNKITRFAACLTILLVMSQVTKAQQVPLFNQYYRTNFLAYPSTAGFNVDPRLSVIYRGQWSGLEGAPRGIAVNYVSKLGEDMGFGLTLQNNEIGLVKQTRVSGGMSYSFYTTNKHALSVGALTSLSFFSLNDDQVSPETFDDEVLRNLIGNNGSAWSMDFSLTYKYSDNLQIDFAVPTLINVSLTDDEYIQINEDNIPDYIAGVRYRFAIDPVSQIYFTPNVTWRYREVIGSEFDVLGKVDYKNKLSVSGGYRNNYGATLGLGFMFNENIEFSYHYDFGKSDVPFLSDGFNEIGLHFRFQRNEEKWNARYQEGAAVIQRLRNEGIYDRSLIDDSEERLAEDYLYSIETEGKKKERRENATNRFDEILEEIKATEQAKLEAEARQRQEAEQEKVRAEQERLAAEERAKQQREEAARLAAEEQERKDREEAVRQETVRKEQEEAGRREQEEKEKLERERPAGTAVIKNTSTIGHEYVIVIASYNINSPWALQYLDQVKATYPDAAIFRSEKRGLDYLYVGGYDSLEPALQRMNEIRQSSDFKDAWVHIIRLSREN